MIIFAISAYYERFIKPFINIETGATIGDCEIKRYPNGEMYVQIHTDIANQDCLIIGSTAPPDGQLIALIMISEALKRNGAKSVQAFLPYLGYSRHDKPGIGEGGGIALIGSLLGASGVDRIITIDTHSELDAKLIKLPFVSIPSASMFIPYVTDLGWDDATIVAPDVGAIVRAQLVADLLSNKTPIAHLTKKHEDGSIVHLNLVGKVSQRVILVDDIIDGGRTVISACNVLRKNDVKDIVVVVTHGLFVDYAMSKMSKLGIKSIFVSDSCPETLKQNDRIIHIVTLDSIIPKVIDELKNGDELK